MPAPLTKRAAKEAPRVRSSRTRRGNSGYAALLCRQTKRATSTAPAANMPQVATEPQPCVSAFEKP